MQEEKDLLLEKSKIYRQEFRESHQEIRFKLKRKIYQELPDQYEFPAENYQDFELNFVRSPRRILFIDKSKYAADLMLEESDLIFLNRPRRFGKSLFLKFIWYVYMYGGNDLVLKMKYPNLTIFNEEYLSNDFWKLLNNETNFPIYLNFSAFNTDNDFNTNMTKELLNELMVIKTALESKIMDLKFSKSEDQDQIAKFELMCSYISEWIKENPKTYEEIFEKLYFLKNVFDCQIILLIDEYESPIIPSLIVNEPNEKEKFLERFCAFFQQIKAKTPTLFSKVIMTGVLSLRHLGIFSGANSFTNFSLDPKYKTAFGFTLDEIKKDKRLTHQISEILKKHKFMLENENEEFKLNHFLKKFFEIYNGFNFTPDRENETVISPISFVKHMVFLKRGECNLQSPLHFKNYWAMTGSTSIIKSLCAQSMNPIAIPKILYDALTSAIEISLLEKVYDYMKPEEMPFNLLLLYTGYFTIKKQLSPTVIKVGWTNEETRNAFFQIYQESLKLKGEFLQQFLKQISICNSLEEEKKEMNIFLIDLQNLFLKIHEKYYQAEVVDYEHNFVFWFFFDVLKAIICQDCLSPVQIFLRWKLTDIEDDLRKGGEPDIIISSREDKIAVIIEFQKTSNKLNFYFFILEILNFCIVLFYYFYLFKKK